MASTTVPQSKHIPPRQSWNTTYVYSIAAAMAIFFSIARLDTDFESESKSGLYLDNDTVEELEKNWDKFMVCAVKEDDFDMFDVDEDIEDDDPVAYFVDDHRKSSSCEDEDDDDSGGEQDGEEEDDDDYSGTKVLAEEDNIEVHNDEQQNEGNDNDKENNDLDEKVDSETENDSTDDSKDGNQAENGSS